MILLYNGIELIEEGGGFGLPVAIFSDKTFFSSSANVYINENGQSKIIVKRFFMDALSIRSWKIGFLIENSLYKLISNFFEGAYRDYSVSRKVIFPLIKLKNKIGVKTQFIKTEPRGEITIIYNVKSDGLEIRADLTKLNKTHLQKVVFLNEQGSTFFRRFFDSNNPDLIDEKIGAWELIKTDTACFTDLNNNLGFCLKKLPNCRLFAGRECITGVTDWAGIEYEVSSDVDFFNYEIQIHVKKEKY